MPEALNTNNSTKRTTVTRYINYKYPRNALAVTVKLIRDLGCDMGLSWGYLCFARTYLSLIPVSNSAKDQRTMHLCVKHKLINCNGMWFSWVADVLVYMSLICYINNNDSTKLCMVIPQLGGSFVR